MKRFEPWIAHGWRLVVAVCGVWILSTPSGFAAGAVSRHLERVELQAGPGSLAPRWVRGPVDAPPRLTWLEPFQDGHRLRVARLAGDDFEAPRDIAHGADWFVNWADTPGVFIDAKGVWTAFWLQRSADSGYAYDIRLAQSSDRGRNWRALPSPHRDATATEHGFVSHFINAAGHPELVWLDGRNTRSTPNGDPPPDAAMTLRTAVLGTDGRPGRARLLDDRVCDCCQTAAAWTDDGPVVVYRDRAPNEIRDIAIIRRLDGRWTEPEHVHDDGWQIAGCPVNGPAVAASGHAVAVAWFTMAGETPRVRLAISQDAGRNFNPPLDFAVGSAIGRVDLAIMADTFVMTWMEKTPQSAALRMVHVDHGGNAGQAHTLVPLERGRISGFPRIQAADATLLIAWTETDANARPRIRVARLSAESGTRKNRDSG